MGLIAFILYLVTVAATEPVLAAEVRDLVLAGRMKAVRASLTHVNWSSTYERQNNPFLECFGCVYILDKVGHRLK